MQGLFGLFGKKTPEQSLVSPANSRKSYRRNRSDEVSAIEDRPSAWDDLRQPEFPIESRFDTDDEQTNWDDAEASDNENNQMVYAQPIVPVVTPPLPTDPDLDDWDEALPAATVKNSNSQEARRGKNPLSVAMNEDLWDDTPIDDRYHTADSQTGSSLVNPNPTAPNRVGRSIQPSRRYATGFWANTLYQFRRILPAPIRQLSDAILTAILVAIVTVSIWTIDGFFVPGVEPSVANPPTAPIASQPSAPTSEQPQVSPEQAFIDAIQSQLSELTSEYPDDIVESLSVDTARDRSIVRLNPIWYSMTEDRQNRLTDRMWSQAQANHFSKLEIQDSQGIAIARSPVVGHQMIILQRHQIS
jgi:hypothetical protein